MTQVESNGQALACEKKADADPAKVLTMDEGGAWRITSQSCRGCCSSSHLHDVTAGEARHN